MTAAATQTFELTVDQIVRRALNLAGLLEASATVDQVPDEVVMARDFLGMEIDAIVSEGLCTNHVVQATVSLNAATYPQQYFLPTSTVDVVVGPDNIAGTISPFSGTDTRVLAISRQEWVTQIVTKTSQAGRPTHVFIERGLPIILYFWPVPTELGLTFNYQRIRLPFDSSDGAKTLDLARRWQKPMTYAVAWQMAVAKSKPLSLVGFLQKTAENEKAKARSSDVEKLNQQFYVPRWT